MNFYIKTRSTHLAVFMMAFSLFPWVGCSDSETNDKSDIAADTSLVDTTLPEEDTWEVLDVDNEIDATSPPEGDTATPTDVVATDDVSSLDTQTPEEDAFSPPQEPLPTVIGGERPAPVYVPENVDSEEKWPLLFMLHGYTASGAIQDAYLKMSSHVTDKGFILVIPDGTIDSVGNGFWNATPACCNFYGSSVDDEGYLSGLIDEAIEKLPVDPERVSFFGHSNGGFMSFRMACNHADKIAAIGNLAGSTYKYVSSCNPTEAVSILNIHGTADDTIPFNGSPYYPSAEDTTQQWVGLNGCDPLSAVESEPISYDKWVPGAETTETRWSDCEQGTEVAFWKMTATGHIPSFDDNFIPDVIDFLTSQTVSGTE